MRSNPDVVEAFESVGLTSTLREQYQDGPGAAIASEGAERNAQIATALAEVQELTAEINRLRAERDRWQAQQAEIMKLLSAKSPDRILHDLRNVLNERELFRTLADLGS
jgi:Tfp pilus assembly protein PilN